MNSTGWSKPFKVFSKAFEIDGKQKDFKYYKRTFVNNENYLGSSNVFIINGKKCIYNNIYHFYQ